MHPPDPEMRRAALAGSPYRKPNFNSANHNNSTEAEQLETAFAAAISEATRRKAVVS